jgi:hypothetical protein
MSKTIPIDQLPREAERLLSAAWEQHESVVLERNGEPVAAVVPMVEYRRWHPEPAKAKSDSRKAEPRKRKARAAAEPPDTPLAYELPADLLQAYHRLVSKKFAEGLTAEEEAELGRLGAELDAADASTPLERNAWEAHQRRMTVLEELATQRKALQQS